MLKRYLVILVIILLRFTNYSFAQTPSWGVGLECNAVSFANSVVQTKDKGYFVGGNGQNIISAIWETYVAKLDSFGNMKWTVPLNGTCNGINLTKDGGCITIGNTSDGQTSGGYDVCVNKVDSFGHLQWSKTIGGIMDDAGYSIIPTNDGGYALTGYTSSFFLNTEDLYVIKLNSSGKLQWSKTIGASTTGNSIGYSIVQTKDGGYAITGVTTSFGAGAEDVYIVKLDSTGNLQWNKTIGGYKNDWANSIIQSRDRGYAITGVSYSYADTVNGDIYIIKLDSAGNLQWDETVGGTSNDIGYTIAQNNDGSYAICGKTNSYGGGASITYYVKLDSLGVLKQTRTFGVPSGAAIRYARQNSDGSFVAVGSIPQNFYSHYYIESLDSSGNNCAAISSGGIIDSGGTIGTGGIITTSDSGRVAPDDLVYDVTATIIQTYFCSKKSGGLNVTPTSTSTRCKNFPDGIINIAVSGGFAPYTYLWTPNVSSSNIATGLSVGTYTVTVKDSLNDSATVIAPLYYSSPVYANCYVTNQICHRNNGSISAATVSGTPPLTYSWSNGGTSSTDSNLIAGTYILTMTDSCGSSFIDTFNISLVNTLRDSIISVTNVSCNNGNDGIATVGVKGGSPPYTYLWSDANHQTKYKAGGLVAGTYTVTVTDSCGGSATASVIITMPDPWMVNISSITNVICGGGSDGSATSNLNAPIVASYSLENVVQHFIVPQSVTTITLSIAGAQGGGGDFGGPGAVFTGTCTVIPGEVLSVAVGGQGGGDGGGGGASWVYDSNIVLYNPVDTLGLIAIAGGGGGGAWSDVTFFDLNYYGGPGGTDLIMHSTTNGTLGINYSGTGGNGGGEIEWEAGGAGWLSNGLTAPYADTGGRDEANHFKAVVYRHGGFGGGGGAYHGCHVGHCGGGGGGGGGYNGGGGGYGGAGGGSYFVNTLPIVQDSEHGNGFVKIYYTITGTDSTYKYSWSNGETTSTATGLSAGTYTLTVSDKNGCSATTSVIITQPVPIVVIADSVKDNGSCNGSAWVTVSGGSLPYSYLWTGNLTTDTINNLCAGNYCYVVTDAIGCKDSSCVTIDLTTNICNTSQGNGAVSVFTNPSKGILTFYRTVANGQWAIEIYNVLGEKIFSQFVLRKSPQTINLNTLASGIYFYKVNSECNGGSTIGHGKIVIEK